MQAPVIATFPLKRPLIIFAGLKLLTGLTVRIMIGLKKNTTRAATEPLRRVFKIVLGGIKCFFFISVIVKPAEPLKKNQLIQRINPPATIFYIELY